MKINIAYRYELDPNNIQRTSLLRHAGTARFAYNWALADRIRRFEGNEGRAKFTSAPEQHRLLNSKKATEFPWMYEVSKCAPQEALRDCDRAFRNFWKRRKQGVGFPRFKKKGVHDAFRLTGSVSVKKGGVKLPRIGMVRTKESTAKFRGKILSATVTRSADRWFVSLSVEQERVEPTEPGGEPVGLDLGIKTFAVLSTGEHVHAPKPLKRKLKKLKHLSRRLSRKQKGSRNRAKTRTRLARLHLRIRNTRRDFLHKLSTRIAKNHSVVCIEDLAISNMVRNKSLARAISDAGWAEFRRMLDYKCSWYMSELKVIDRFAPSSKTCSECGTINSSLRLSDRVWVCQVCGCVHERDDNASKNILNFGMVGMGSHRPEPGLLTPSPNACGDGFVNAVVEAGSKHISNTPGATCTR